MSVQTIAEKIKQRRLQLLVHSCIYYKLDQNIVSDSQWNKWSEELKQLQSEYPDISKEVEWFNAFDDWDGSTGAFLPLDDEWVMNKANQLLVLHNQSKPVISTPKSKVKPKTSSLALF